jgi:hypothetical protein
LFRGIKGDGAGGLYQKKLRGKNVNVFLGTIYSVESDTQPLIIHIASAAEGRNRHFHQFVHWQAGVCAVHLNLNDIYGADRFSIL